MTIPTPAAIASRRGGGRPGRALIALIALVAVIGILAMHGPMTDHGATMTGMIRGDAAGLRLAEASAGHDPAAASEDEFGSPMTGQPAARTAVLAVTVSGHVRRAGSPADMEAMEAMEAMDGMDGMEGMDGMALACLAFASGLLLLVRPRRLLARLTRTIYQSSFRSGVVWLETASRRWRPDLAELSVLRT